MEVQSLSNRVLVKKYAQLNDELFAVREEISKRDIHWKTLAFQGQRVLAVIIYYKANHCTATEARNVVDTYLKTKETKKFYDQGWNAFIDGEAFDVNATRDWKDGWRDCESAIPEHRVKI